jgi:hypothetical protein
MMDEGSYDFENLFFCFLHKRGGSVLDYVFVIR